MLAGQQRPKRPWRRSVAALRNFSASGGLGSLHARGLEHGSQQAGEACLELLPAQGDVAMRAVHSGMGHPRLPQHLEVVREGRLRHRRLHGAAGLLLAVRQRTHDLEPNRIAQRVQNVRKGYLVYARMMKVAHEERWFDRCRMIEVSSLAASGVLSTPKSGQRETGGAGGSS